jgi:hypothetical protein
VSARSRRHLAAFAAGWVAALPAAWAQTIPPPAAIGSAFSGSVASGSEETAKGHGTVSIGYQNTYINGMFLPVPGGKAPIGTIRVQSMSFDLDYFVADRWSVHLGIPFIASRYRGSAPHCIRTDPAPCQGAVVPLQPHPESKFLDDGSYHGTWQDWHLGLAHHANVNDYLLTPSISLQVPSHRYTFFGQSAPGQGLWKVELAMEVAHQLDMSNLYYRVRVGHVFAEKTLGQSIDHDKLDLELGYFLNDTWTVKAFAVGKKGKGYPGAYDRTTELWYHHDQRAKHNYASLGGGFDYHVDDKYTVSATVQRLVWGQFVFDFRYSVDVRLIREF